MTHQPTQFTRTDTHFPNTTLFRSLREADEAGIEFKGCKVRDEETISALGRDLKAWGVDVMEVAPGELDHCGRRIRFSAPTGHQIELFASKTYKIGRAHV